MKKKNIFHPKKTYINYYFFLVFILLLISAFIFLLQKQSEYFIVNENTKNFYNIPKDKKGKKVSNTNIKILDYDFNLNKKIEKNDTKIDFSIQLHASSKYDNIYKIYNEYKNNLSFYKEDLFIVSLKHNLGIEYLLIYKNFINYKTASDYCKKYLDLLDNCLIVNIKNLD